MSVLPNEYLPHLKEGVRAPRFLFGWAFNRAWTLELARRRRLTFDVPHYFRRYLGGCETFNFADMTEDHLKLPMLRKLQTSQRVSPQSEMAFRNTLTLPQTTHLRTASFFCTNQSCPSRMRCLQATHGAHKYSSSRISARPSELRCTLYGAHTLLANGLCVPYTGRELGSHTSTRAGNRAWPGLAAPVMLLFIGNVKTGQATHLDHHRKKLRQLPNAERRQVAPEPFHVLPGSPHRDRQIF